MSHTSCFGRKHLFCEKHLFGHTKEASVLRETAVLAGNICFMRTSCYESSQVFLEKQLFAPTKKPYGLCSPSPSLPPSLHPSPWQGKGGGRKGYMFEKQLLWSSKDPSVFIRNIWFNNNNNNIDNL